MAFSSSSAIWLWAKYDGPLDERSIGALVEVRAGTTSLFDLTNSLAPADAARALGGPWRSEAEFAVDSAAQRALFETPIGELSDPFVLDGQIAVARILERQTAIPDSHVLARLSVSGFETWLASQEAAATIVRAAAPTTRPDASAPERGLPAVLPVTTPRLPVVPPVSE